MDHMIFLSVLKMLCCNIYVGRFGHPVIIEEVPFSFISRFFFSFFLFVLLS